ncbi:MAG: FtsB family cell division protein [Candidatus Kryptoniota bacterium]
MKKRNIEKFIRKMKMRNVLLMILGTLIVVYFLFDERGLIQRIRLGAERASLEKRIEALQRENTELRIEINKLQTSDEEIERIAREKYFMRRNGEETYKVESK